MPSRLLKNLLHFVLRAQASQDQTRIMKESWESSANSGILPIQCVLEMLQCLESVISGDPTAVCS